MTRPLRCCVDLTANETFDRHGGIGKYARYLTRALSRHPDVLSGAIELSVIEHTGGPVLPVDEWTDHCGDTPLVPMNRHKWRRRLQLGGTLNRAKLDVFHATQPAALPLQRGYKVLSTIHDIIPLSFPGPEASWWPTQKNRARWYRRTRGADGLLTISEHTRADMHRLLGIASDQVTVVHHGVDFERFSAAPNDAASTAARLGLPTHAIVSVGSDHYRKNQRVLLDGWCRYAASGGRRDLLFVGRSLYEDTFPKLIIEARTRGYGDRVHWRNDISDADLPAVYRLADIAVAPSRYEGFGMTILEAMASGTPVIAADNGVYQEVGGSALLSVDPDDPASVADALWRWESDTAQSEARQLSLAHVSEFTWDRCADQTLACYRRVAQRSA